MQLNYEGRQKLRKEVEKKLALVPEGERIKLPKETLEQLLFETKKLKYKDSDENPNKLYDVKFLVWSGEFLKKIDLSEVSFEDVTWNVKKIDMCRSFAWYQDENEQDVSLNACYKQFGVDSICLSNTNANVDFFKSFEFKLRECVIINNCNFSNTDLSSNILNGKRAYCVIVDSNLDNTSIKVTNEECDYNDIDVDYFRFVGSSFVNCDFSKVRIDASCFDPVEALWRGNYIYDCFAGCNLCNTRITISLEKTEEEGIDLLRKWSSEMQKYNITNPYQFYTYNDGEESYLVDGITLFEKRLLEDGYKEEAEEIRKFNERYNYIGSIASFNKALQAGYLYGCYVNGKRIPTPEERETKKSQLLSEYQMFEDETISSVLGEVDTAIKSTRKK